jgi:hypothetical protein
MLSRAIRACSAVDNGGQKQHVWWDKIGRKKKKQKKYQKKVATKHHLLSLTLSPIFCCMSRVERGKAGKGGREGGREMVITGTVKLKGEA